MRKATALFFSFLLFATTAIAADDGRVRPYVLGSNGSGDLKAQVDSSRQALSANGFEIVGEYAPYDNAHILIVTSDALKKHAAGSDFGGYGAAQRVSVTDVGGQVQVSYTNPAWMANVYRMGNDLDDVSAALKAALGAQKEYGSGGGRTKDNLREYHYMVFMPYFDDHVELASYGSHAEAVAAVEAGLAAGKGGTEKLFSVAVTGKDELLIGVAIHSGEGADKTVMGVVDQSDLRHSAHLPYEMLVSGSKVYAQHGKFRIAQSFPDLTMTTFMKISNAPDAIETSLKAAASGK
ncbi:MAG: hypothetical protein ABW146_01450 [Candidatus Sedimenticola sp. 6PFRAG7]